MTTSVLLTYPHFGSISIQEISLTQLVPSIYSFIVTYQLDKFLYLASKYFSFLFPITQIKLRSLKCSSFPLFCLTTTTRNTFSLFSLLLPPQIQRQLLVHFRMCVLTKETSQSKWQWKTILKWTSFTSHQCCSIAVQRGPLSVNGLISICDSWAWAELTTSSGTW